MTDLTQIRDFQLKVIFVIHFLTLSLSTLGYWSTGSYMFYNVILIISLLWAIKEHDSGEPLQLAIAINGLSIVLDIFVLVMCYPDSHSARERFSSAVAIINLIGRPVSIIFLSKIHGERTGTQGLLDNMVGNRRNQSYEDIDRSAPPPNNNFSSDFTAAQQI